MSEGENNRTSNPAASTPRFSQQGLVSVELSDLLRYVLGTMIRANGPVIYRAASEQPEWNTPGNQEHWRRIFMAARSNVPLWLSLLKRPRKTALGCSTIKIDRGAARFWGHVAATMAADNKFSDDARLDIFGRVMTMLVAIQLAKALTTRRGKRPKISDESIHRTVAKYSLNGRAGDPISRVANKLNVNVETVRRAIKRHQRRPIGRAAKMLLSD